MSLVVRKFSVCPLSFGPAEIPVAQFAMDRATIVSVTETVKTPAGEFTNCLKVEETTPLQRFVTEYKYYAPGIGMVQDGSMKLVKVGRAEGPGKSRLTREGGGLR